MTTDALALRADAPPRHPWLDRDLYPFAHRYAEVEGHRVHYVDEGDGPVVLMVHGTPSWSFEWRAQVSALRDRFRCVAVDHLGFGLSDKPDAVDYTPAAHARRLAALVRALDLRDVTLVVHDFGGPIGLGAALEDSDRYARAVVVNSWAWSLEDRPDVRRLSRFVASWLGRFLYRVLNLSPRVLLPASFGDRAKLTPAARAHYLGPFSARREREAPWVLGKELYGSSAFYGSVWSRRASLPPVSEVVWGARDPAFGEDILARWTEAFPSARVTRVEGAGHFPQEESPDVVSEAIARAASTR